jgi:hypothetical protein
MKGKILKDTPHPCPLPLVEREEGGRKEFNGSLTFILSRI